MEDVESVGEPFAFSEKSIRMGFIRKVYAILTLQLVVTFGMVSVFTYVEPVQAYVVNTPAVIIAAAVLSIVLVIVLVCTPNLRRKTPHNLILLGLFTLVEGYLVGSTCAMIDQPDVVGIAMVATLVITLALTLFAFQTKIDFTLMYATLYTVFILFIVFGIFMWVFPGRTTEILYCSLGVLIFSMYIVIDTQMMIGGKHQYSLSPEEYIFAALNLYLDIINLFMYILRIVAAAKN